MGPLSSLFPSLAATDQQPVASLSISGDDPADVQHIGGLFSGHFDVGVAESPLPIPEVWISLVALAGPLKLSNAALGQMQAIRYFLACSAGLTGSGDLPATFARGLFARLVVWQ